jgi:ribosomal protein S4E
MREYKEFVAQGAIKVDGVVVSDENFIPQNFDNHIVVNIGKKRRVLIKK